MFESGLVETNLNVNGIDKCTGLYFYLLFACIKVNYSYLLISEGLQNTNRKLLIDSIVYDLNKTYKTFTFEAMSSIGMSSILFHIEKSILIQANICEEQNK